jgi:hypothetical protein
MAKMPLAGGASDLGAMAICIQAAGNSSGNLIVKAGPAALGIEFIKGAVEWCTALTADVQAGGLVIGIFSTEGPLGAFVNDHSLLIWCKIAILHLCLLCPHCGTYYGKQYNCPFHHILPAKRPYT